jgi:hypothetical protein
MQSNQEIAAREMEFKDPRLYCLKAPFTRVGPEDPESWSPIS